MSAPHPELLEATAEEPRCEFALCLREAEMEVALPAIEKPVLVCGLHISPVVTWGVPEPAEPPRITYLACRPESAE